MKRNINEAAGDLFRANLSRFGQGFKNIVGAGTLTQDSKDTGVETLFLRFKEKFDKITPSAPTVTPTVTTSGSISPSGSITPTGSVTPTTSPTGSTSTSGSSATTGSISGSLTSTAPTGSTSSESSEFLSTHKNLNTDLIKIFQQPRSDNLTISGSHTAVYKTSPILFVTSSTFNGNIDILGLVNNNPINKNYIGMESSHATTLIINPKGRSIVPEGIINEALNTEQQELYLDFLKDLSWYFKIQPNPDMSTYNPEKVLEWMKTQGERFKYILDYLDQKLGTTAPVVPTTATSGSSDVNEQLKKELDIYISDEFLTNLSIIYPEKILNSKLKDNANTRMPNSSKTLMAFKIEGNKISSLKLKFNSKNTIRFEIVVNYNDLKSKEKELFNEVTISEIARLSKVFKTKLFNTLTFRYVNNTSLSGGKSFEELKNAIEKYLTPRVDAAANKMTDSIKLTLINIIHVNNNINPEIFVGINNKGIKFIMNTPIPENKLFKTNDSKNKNIFKLI